jgi:phage terminase small subunit
MFAMLCVQIATWHEANQLVNDAGLLITAGQDLIPSPALTIRVQADAMTEKWAKLFGLTPDAPAAPARPGMRHLREA